MREEEKERKKSSIFMRKHTSQILVFLAKKNSHVNGTEFES